MSRFFNIPRFRVILKCIRNYPKVRKCRNEAIRVKELGYYDKVPGQLGLVNDIIKNPEKHFKEFSEYGDIDSYPLESYGTYMSHRILQGAPEKITFKSYL
tara:strand:- start:4 stop:303 length:300 start_codon:yes stop_codon:yes gene_type:complete